VERFHDVIRHTHELIVYGGRMHALCYEVINGPRSVAQTKRKHCWAVPGKASRIEWFSSGKLCHDVGEREREVGIELVL
jgi:hypothetical protein